jgi:hypothetical protein
MADLLEGNPLGRAPDFGGPEVLNGHQILDVWRERHRRPRAVVGLRWPGRVHRAFAEWRNTCPDHREGHQTWSEFVHST